MAVLRAAAGPVPTMAAAWFAAFLLAFFHARSDALLIALGFLGAMLAGLVGLGGAVVMIPLLLYVPPLLGQPALDIHTVAGITMVQVAAAGVAGLLGHLHHRPIRGRLVAVLGSSTALGSLTGAVVSRWVGSEVLAGVFASLALAASVLMFLPQSWSGLEAGEQPYDFSAPMAAAAGVLVGAMGGMVGAGGGILLVPFMIYALKVPLRSAIGASLGIVLFSGIAGLAGKAVTGQVNWLMALALVAGALPGARLGASLSRRTPAGVLSRVLGVLIGIAALGMWWDVLR
ncbi:MAG: UPF0721 transmembrane protein YrkJ [Gemmatimonadales bacterium]|nr:hypothetical protein HRbin33_00910 [bacterium HR33]GIW52980.1 MAG: UPF0721 transmembrane protein YrkJ [Gemmatimonadales bacterium]